jgi:hypothetical protein
MIFLPISVDLRVQIRSRGGDFGYIDEDRFLIPGI